MRCSTRDNLAPVLDPDEIRTRCAAEERPVSAIEQDNQDACRPQVPDALAGGLAVGPVLEWHEKDTGDAAFDELCAERLRLGHAHLGAFGQEVHRRCPPATGVVVHSR